MIGRGIGRIGGSRGARAPAPLTARAGVDSESPHGGSSGRGGAGIVDGCRGACAGRVARASSWKGGRELMRCVICAGGGPLVPAARSVNLSADDRTEGWAGDVSERNVDLASWSQHPTWLAREGCAPEGVEHAGIDAHLSAVRFVRASGALFAGFVRTAGRRRPSSERWIPAERPAVGIMRVSGHLYDVDTSRLPMSAGARAGR